MTANLYKAQLHEAGLASTRAVAITEAISELHKAFAACDLTNRNIVRDLFGNLTVDQMITDFAKTEDLNKEIFDQDAEPLEDRIYSVVKERIEEDIPYQVGEVIREYFQKFDFSSYVDDYIEAKIDRILEGPVQDKVQESLQNVKLVVEEKGDL
jgi:hypothetical protein|tara:strand:+ start:379 stop:840 length:462 start_codon:yes stop_codon:yes gene_type:complete